MCLLCRARATHLPGLCAGCVEDLPYSGPACERCAAPKPEHAACPQCARRPPPQDRTICPFLYRTPVSDLIHMMKFGPHLQAAHLLGVLLARHLDSVDASRPALILPVPLHRQRLRTRGFNQALEVARPVAKRLGIRLDGWSVGRLRSTLPQAGLGSAGERARNVRGAFHVPASLSRFQHVAVLDDVVTTGATAGELVRQLKRAGVERVEVWACAKA